MAASAIAIPASPSAAPAVAAGLASAASASAAAAISRASSDTTHRVQLPPPPTPADADQLRVLFAQRLVAAHPDTSYMTPAPDRLLAIPVLEVELNANGSVRRIVVLRKPTTGSAATALAIAAVRRAAPYGDVSRLPRPWKVVETFLFDDQMRFKPRTLDL